jgi:hypothetical protein
MRTPVRRSVALAAAMTAHALTTSAHADEPQAGQAVQAAAPAPAKEPVLAAPAYTVGTQPEWYVLAGVTTGGTLVAHDRGGYVGGEASIVRLGRATQFFGFYADGYHDFGGSRTYVTSGVEGGYKLVGLDGGLATRFGGDRPEWGATGRLFVGIGVVSVYGRYAYFADSLGMSDEHVVQVGVLVKMPFKVWDLQ